MCPLVSSQQDAGFDVFKVTVFIGLRQFRKAGGHGYSVTSLHCGVIMKKYKYCHVKETSRGLEIKWVNRSLNASCQKAKDKSAFKKKRKEM